VFSARYAGEGASDEDNNNRMLEELRGVPEAERTARYQCLIVFMRSHTDPVPIITQGSWEGRILEAPQGDGGFGYDPIFFVPSHGCSGGELPLEVKNTISHRAIALKAMLAEFRKHGYITN
jgi:XTP/dITP diphosphohydrolase